MKKKLNTFSVSVLCFLALFTIFTTSGCKKDPVVVTPVETPSIGILSKNSVDGRTFTQLVKEYWSISFSVPMAKHPGFAANTNPDLSKFVSSSVIFLHGADVPTVNRSISIKKGQYIFAPLQIGAVWYTKGDTCDAKFVPKAGQSDLDFLSSEILPGFNTPTLVATLNGKALYTNLFEQRVKTGIFEAPVHPDYNTNNCDWRPKKSIAYGDGYWVAFQPPVGTHELIIGGTIPLSPTSGLKHTVIYTLKVE